MSRVGSDLSAAKRRHHAAVFAALADETRLALVTTLCGGEPRSIAQLTGGSRMTRQAITKHLRGLEGAGIVHSGRSGRESRVAFGPAPPEGLKEDLGRGSAPGGQGLSRLQTPV